jgi:glycosyltransferase involved in cell wall biosynthesis
MTAPAGARQPQLSIFIPSFGEGGVDRMLVNIATGIAQRGVAVDFIVTTDHAPYLADLGGGVRILRFEACDDDNLARELACYLDSERPEFLMTGKGRDDRIALAARDRLASIQTRYVLRVGTAVASRARSRLLFRWQQRKYGRKLLATCSRYDVLLANAEAVATEICQATGLSRERIAVVPNPTVTERLYHLASAPPEHPWLTDDDVPVIMGIGGLRRQKDFGTLIRAFASLHQRRPCRLIILGSGRQLARLQRLAQRLGVAEDVDLPGFTANPYAYLSRASLFVLSSLWEGLPNVLIEALALGTPVVATDCPGGAHEILEGGRYGPLVKPGDYGAMSAAMGAVLKERPDSTALKSAAARYTVDAATDAYLAVLRCAASPEALPDWPGPNK